ncbi:hypothetical protein, partial [Paenibacillus apiarius]|uniref:hypothetical protein n=1 Tax=Paenibacillus apiarius TaxID=46240 RepID=UPI003B3B67CC
KGKNKSFKVKTWDQSSSKEKLSASSSDNEKANMCFMARSTGDSTDASDGESTDSEVSPTYAELKDKYFEMLEYLEDLTRKHKRVKESNTSLKVHIQDLNAKLDVPIVCDCASTSTPTCLTYEVFANENESLKKTITRLENEHLNDLVISNDLLKKLQKSKLSLKPDAQLLYLKMIC